MSRIGKKPILIPEKVEVTVTASEIKVKGPKGELVQQIHPHVTVAVNDGIINITVKDEELKSDRALWGLFGSLITNMVLGVTKGFEKKLLINGIGFKVKLDGKNLNLNLGFSHEVIFNIPDDVTVEVEKNRISVTGIDKQRVGEVAAQIRKLRKPEPYKGKGIQYEGEKIKRKVGKAAGKAE